MASGHHLRELSVHDGNEAPAELAEIAEENPLSIVSASISLPAAQQWQADIVCGN